jgi:hypothetical protein
MHRMPRIKAGRPQRVLTACIAFCALAGCGGAGSPPPMAAGALPAARVRQSARVYPSYRTNDTMLFVGDTGNQYVAIYRASKLKKNPISVALITDSICGPAGMALDKQGTLYVANSCGSPPEVTEYPKGQTTHSVAISDGINYPEGLAVDKNGTLYVTSYPSAVVEYAPGSTYPSQTITGGGLSDPYGLGLDEKQNLYIADMDAHAVFEVPYGTTNVVNLNLQGVDSPVNVKFDKYGNLWEADNGNNYVSGFVNVYPPGSQTPTETIKGFGYPYALSIDKRGTVVIGNTGSPAAVYAYKPGQYTPYATLTSGVSIPTGVLIGKP